jgi:hypothetical protein
MEVIPQLGGSMEHGIHANYANYANLRTFLTFLKKHKKQWESELGWEELENQTTCA